ncbi:MAG TPA: PaaI family thioesterase [Aliidongia sp.]|uniref:PaaI family thioesterase n=1 Tax=Aliidongia sp. TaxID=1914230 RepID=UPI002DDCDBE3|nr:PaaI family thioesterase [Aliidongia sp.]HEV2673185.1 PaaI family thioesterase [Aliidongia sp.]
MSEFAARFTSRQEGYLPGLLGLEWVDAKPGWVHGRFDVLQHHLAPNGYLHAATVVALADSACGFGCLGSLPDGATSFTTIELKANFVGTAREGGVRCEARMVHGGRTTQLWDAEVKSETTGKTVALFRCTQMILYPPPAPAARP